MTHLKPDAAKNISFVAHSDMGGRRDGVQIMVHRGYAYVGHGFSNGISVIDVHDPRQPKTVNFIACPPGTRALHLQTHDDLLLCVNAPSVWTMEEFQQDEKVYFGASPAESLKRQMGKFTPGVRIFDISRPEEPREISFMPVHGIGPHRLWYVGGRYAYASIHFADFSDHVFSVIDLNDITRPEVVGRWWIPGMWTGGGETPTWKAGRRYALHHALVAGDLAFGAWRDGGLTILDIKDKTQPKLLAYRNTDPPFGGMTHSPLPLMDRNLLIVGDEAVNNNGIGGPKYIWVYDIREPGNPVSIATMPQPAEADYCAKGGKFGSHNLHENRPGAFQSSRLVFATYYNAGVRAFDITNPFRPEEVAYFVPPAPEQMMDPRPGMPQVIQNADCYVDKEGYMYLTDPNAGLYILKYEGPLM